MTHSGYIRSRPKAEVTAALYTSRYALQTFDRGSCKRSLDVGCGEAFFEQRHPHRFIGIDIDLARLAEAHPRSVSNLIIGSAERLPFPDGGL